jgi:hypothetical protein
MKRLILFLSIIGGAGLTMAASITRSLMQKPGVFDIPASVQTARDYFQHVDPRRFYKVAGPVNLILIVLTLTLFWQDAVPLRFYFAAAFACYAGILVLALACFVPRNRILFTWSISDHLEQVRTASTQWSAMNWIHSLLGMAGVLFSFKGLDTYYAGRCKKT